MPSSEANPCQRLLPKPKELHVLPGICRLNTGFSLDLLTDEPRVEWAFVQWKSTIGDPGTSTGIDAPCRSNFPNREDRPITVRVAIDEKRVEHRDGYRLDIRPDLIEVAGNSPAGCFHALQTIQQLATLAGPPSDSPPAEISSPQSPIRNPVVLRCCTVIDWPDFEIRGLLFDVTRGRVPTLETLERLVDRLALLKVNQLQLNIEHAFVFPFDPDICGPDDGLTPDEVRQLDVYCRDRFIELVPALATFGHMGRVLSMPKYRHLAEIEATKDWEDMDWIERMRGLTLDCMNPEAHRLVERMWSDVLDAFSSPVVNICGDEPWDLGCGKNSGRLAGDEKGKAYVEHIRRAHDFCAARGRTTQFWSDIVKDYAHLLDRLPRDSTVLHWGYDDRANYEGTEVFVSAGLDTFVCPGTSGWKRIINAVDLAERNISTFAAAGKAHGARGLLNTDWGDHGHFNMPASSLHGIALGAAAAWSADHPTGDDFDKRFARIVLGVDDATGIRHLRKASRIAETCETWRLLWMPLGDVSSEESLAKPDGLAPCFKSPTGKRAAGFSPRGRSCNLKPAAWGGALSHCLRDEALEKTASAAHALQHWCGRSIEKTSGDSYDLEELALAARFTELLTEKLAFALGTENEPTRDSTSSTVRSVWAKRLGEAADTYADLWRRRTKPSGLEDILRALSAAADDTV